MKPPRPSIATHEVAALANFVAPRRGLGCPMMELDKTHLKTIFNLWILMKERNIHNRIVALREKNYIFVYDIYSIFVPATLQLSDTVHWVAKINNWSTVVSATEIGLDGNWRKHLSTRKWTSTIVKLHVCLQTYLNRLIKKKKKTSGLWKEWTWQSGSKLWVLNSGTVSTRKISMCESETKPCSGLVSKAALEVLKETPFWFAKR